MIDDQLTFINKNLSVSAQKTFRSYKPNSYEVDTGFPITYILTRLFASERLEYVTIAIFCHELENFNRREGSSLKLSDFTEIHWVRIVNEQVEMASLIWSLTRRYAREEKTGIPASQEILLQFLSLIESQFNVDNRIEFSRSALQDKIDEIIPGSSIRIIDVLLSCQLLSYNKQSDTYWFHLEHHETALVDELTMGLWKTIVGPDPSLDKFRIFLHKIYRLGLWSRSIDRYFSGTDKERYCVLFEEFIGAEADLVNGKDEYMKGVLDSRSWKNIDITKIPTILLDEPDSFSLIHKVDAIDGNGAGLYSHQKSRSIYALGVLLLLQCDTSSPKPFTTVRVLLSRLDRPYIVVKLFDQIVRSDQEVIPYLVNDASTISLAFLALEKIDYRADLLPSGYLPKERLEQAANWKNQIRQALLDVALTYLRQQGSGAASAVVMYRFLHTLLKEAFSRTLDTGENIKRHQLYIKEYNRLFSFLTERMITVGSTVFYSPFDVTMLYEFEKITSDIPVIRKSQYLQLGDVQFKLLVDLLKAVTLRQKLGFDDEYDKSDLFLFRYSLVETIAGLFEHYLTSTEVTVVHRPGNDPEVLPAKRGVTNPFLDITEWGILFLELERNEKIAVITASLLKGLTILTTSGLNEYSEPVIEAGHKVRAFLRAIYLGYLNLVSEKEDYRTAGLPVERTIGHLDTLIASLSVRFSRNDLPNGKTDVFADKYGFRNNYLYTEDLLTLLFQCVNASAGKLGFSFVKDFFDQSQDVGRLLHAINDLTDPGIKDHLTHQIDTVPINSFIDSVYHHELMDALINAVNSDSSWEKAETLLKQVEKNLSNRIPGQEDPDAALFEVRLLLAYKAKDFTRLDSTPWPLMQGMPAARQERLRQRKTYFQAVFKSYNDGNYNAAIQLLEPIVRRSSNDPDPDILVHWFRAKTLNALAQNHTPLLVEAYNEWESIFSKLSEEKKGKFQRLSALITVTKLHYQGFAKDYDSIDAAVRELPLAYKFDEEFHSVITTAYKERNLLLPAWDYLNKVVDFYASNRLPLPPNVSSLRDSVYGEQAIDQLRTAMGIIRNLSAKDIPRVLPKAINEGKNLEEFILKELTQACEIVLDKIEGIRFVKEENRYSDLILAILKSRFGLWSWAIGDQNRLGTAKKDAGEADLTVQSTGTGTIITVIEALKYKNDHQGHVTRLRSQYSTSLRFFYIFIYVVDTKDGLDTAWAAYTKDIAEIDFSLAWGVGKKNESMMAIDNFDVPLSMRIGKSAVGPITLYHLMMKIPEV